jgi:membrane-associated phospholipid phosphatase
VNRVSARGPRRIPASILAKPRSTLPFVLVAVLLAPASALAETPLAEPAPPPAAEQPARPRMRVHVPFDLTLSGVGGAAWITTEILKSKIAPSTCRWCEPPGIDLGVKNALRWDNTKAADVASYVTGFALAPLAAFGLDAAVVYASGGTLGEWGEDALVILESIVVAADLNQIVKFAVARERPFVHDLEGAAKNGTSSPGDNNLSFYSGHATLGFVSAVSAGTVATLKGYKAAPWIWATGLTIAVATGYLRIAADKHYFIDVMTGTVMGSAMGFLVPWLHRPAAAGDEKGARVTGMMASPIEGGGAVVGVRGILF